MFEVSHVAVCADGSSGSLTAFDHARRYCTASEPRIRLVRVLPPLPSSMKAVLSPFAAMGSDTLALRRELISHERDALLTAYAIPPESLEDLPAASSYLPPSEDLDSHEARDEGLLEPDLEEVPPQGPHTFSMHCVPCLENRSVTKTLQETLTELGPEMIFAGSSGEGGSRVGMLGTVAETLASTAPCPVFLARASERCRPVKTILAAIDLSPSSQAVYSTALSLALRFEANLHVLVVLPSPTGLDIAGILSSHLKYDGRSLKQKARRDLRKRLSTLREETEVPFPWRAARDGRLREQLHIEFGDPVTKLLSAAEDLCVDLFILGRQGARKAPIAQRIGRTSRALLTTLSCHCLVIPPPSSPLVLP